MFHETVNRTALIDQIHRPQRLSKSYWPCLNRHLSNATDLSLTSIRPAGSIVGRAKPPGSPESEFSGA
jgi:hypothetical protein